MTDATTPTFNAGAAYEIKLRTPGRVKTATLRFPTVSEWAARQRAIKTIQHRLGPGQTETKTEGIEAADFELLKKLQLDDNDASWLDGRGPGGHRDEFDKDEAAELIQRLARADVDADPTHEGDAVIVSLTVLGGIVTKHAMRMPTVAELRAHRRNSFSFTDMRRGRTQIRYNVEEFCRFYELLCQRIEGYDEGGRVPPMHRMAVVSDLLTVIDDLEAEDDPKN